MDVWVSCLTTGGLQYGAMLALGMGGELALSAIKERSTDARRVSGVWSRPAGEIALLAGGPRPIAGARNTEQVAEKRTSNGSTDGEAKWTDS